MEYRHIADYARLYHRVLSSVAALTSTQFEGPNGRGAERRAAFELLNEILPRYRETIPPELQAHLGLNIDDIERQCRSRLCATVQHGHPGTSARPH